MLFSGNLLKRYINIKDEPESIANYLTLKTCEIESIYKRNIPENVVIGYVTFCEKHSNADKLFVTNIDCGDKGTFQIVTGAENIKKDIYVPVALSGTYLPAKDINIKPVNMRGIKSVGMICSKEELGIQEDLHMHGIWILDDDLNTLSKADLGKPIILELPFLNNFVFDIDNKTLTNRPDLTGHLGQAIELYTIYKNFDSSKIYMHNILNIFEQFSNTNIFELLEHANKAEKKVFLDTEKARSYIALEIKDIKVEKSGFKERLELIDLQEKPINNYVDFSNLFMFLTSSPIHFFDADKINGNIVVRQSVGGEKFIDIMGKEHILQVGDVIITDDEKILALAGIIGGFGSGITQHTKNILVEIANFDPIQIRKTGNRLNLRTNAKIRFEKNINPLFSLYSLLLFLDQFKLSGLQGKIGGLSYAYDNETKKLFSKMVNIDFSELKNFIGIDDLDQQKINDILSYLGFSIFKNAVKVPYFRSPADINIKEDIFEELIRIYGYENIHGKNLQKEVEFVDYNPKIQITRLFEEIFVDNYHYTLIETYSWFEEKFVNNFKELNKDTLYSLQNPIAPENKYLRDNLYYNLIQVVEKNFRNYDNIKIFEIGKIFNQEFKEKLVVGACIYKKNVNSWKENNIFELKNIVNDILQKYDIRGLVEYKKENIQGIAHPKQSAKIFLNNQFIGEIFTLHPYYHKEFKFDEKSQITLLQIDLEKLIDFKLDLVIQPIHKIDYNTTQDQIVQRDLSFVIKKDDDYGKILSGIGDIEEIKDYEVFDIYDLEDKKSISLTITIKGENMDNNYINSIMQKAIKAVEKVGGTLR